MPSPVQACPTDPPIYCHMPECVGWPNPPTPYRCTSRSTWIENSVEYTMFGCPCCSFTPPDCEDETCVGNEDKRCTTELQKNCHCIDPIEYVSDEEIMFGTASPSCPHPALLVDFEESTTPPGLPPGLYDYAPGKSSEHTWREAMEVLGLGQEAWPGQFILYRS